MIEKWKTISVTASLSAILLLGLATAPCAAELHNGSAPTQSHVASTEEALATVTAGNSTDKAAVVATPKKQKSVLDAESLESPLSFFRDITLTDEDETDISVRPGALMLALKALVATLLSTII